jgi:hypothetical protein
MSISAGTLFVVFVALVGVLFVGGMGAAIWFFVWANRSDSPRAARIRHLLGGSEKKREDGAKAIHWLGEEKMLRREAATAFAASRRLRHAPADTLLPSRVSSFPQTFPGGGRAAVEDVITWEEERRSVTVATFVIEASPISEHRNTYTTLLIDASDLRLPPFFITGETIVHKGLFGGNDIDFPDDPAFSDRYHLESSDAAAVRALFTPALRRAFVEAGNCHLECVSSTLMFRELEQTTVRGYELFVDDSLKLYHALTRIAG